MQDDNSHARLASPTANALGRTVRAKAALLAVVLVLSALVTCGCGAEQSATPGKEGASSFAVKASFVVAADHICAMHLQNIMAWLARPRAGAAWQQQATMHEGIYRILASTIQRIEALGPPPGPDAASFTGYVQTLKARAIVYRLESRANRRRDTSSASQLEHRLDGIDDVGDRDAHRYGQRLCGAGMPDLNKAFAPTGGESSQA